MVQDDTTRIEKTDATVKIRLRKMLEDNYKDEIKLKFTAFEAFLTKKAKSNKIAKGFIYRRLFTALLERTLNQKVITNL